MKQVLFIIFLFQFWNLILNAQMTIKVIKTPHNTAKNARLFLAGNFNDWQANDPNFELKKNGDELYEITFSPPQGDLYFKFTRGTWDTVEGNTQRQFRENRHYYFHGKNPVFEVEIQSWEDKNAVKNVLSTATENVYILQEDFYIPQLDRHRRVLVYLPKDYYQSDKKYPVIYAQDGQNIFDAYTSFSGEWELDESMNRLFEQGDYGSIIIGIDNGGSERLNEYTAWSHPKYGGGQAPQYVDFLVHKLKPYIDAKYRTQSNRESTSIMGSSLGGLLSMYAAINYQHIFGKAVVFSPSFWFSEGVFTQVKTIGKQAEMKIYLLAGEQEDNGSVAKDVRKMYQVLLESGFDKKEIFLDIDADGEHSEWYWKREFPAAYQWLSRSE